jgi:hypothetical protein
MFGSLQISRTLALSIVAGAALHVLAGYAPADIIFEDTFDYADRAALLGGGWTDTGVGTPNVNTQIAYIASGSGFMSSNENERPETQTGLTVLHLNNAATYHEVTPFNGDWMITVAFVTNAYQRSSYVGVTDANGVGYALRINSATPTNNNLGHGSLHVYETTGWAGSNGAPSVPDLNAPLGIVTSTAYLTGFAVPPGQPAQGSNAVIYNNGGAGPNDPFLGFTFLDLKYTAATGVLEVYQDFDPTPLISVIDITPVAVASFSRIYLGGGTSGFFDSVTLDAVPEPTSLGIVGMAAGGLLLARRRQSRA